MDAPTEIVVTTISGVIVAMVSGIAVVALKYPKAYEKMFRPLVLILLGIFSAVIIWDVSNVWALQAALDHTPIEKWNEVKNAINSKQVFSEPIY